MRRAILLASLALCSVVHIARAIYPDDHWTYSTKLTESSFTDAIQAEIDAGRTMFAPAWNAVTRAFTGNDDVVFGDVNLSEEPIRGEPHNPGAGGWPTIRYFNKETGIEGGTYEKKTDKKMCDELGDEEMMTAYVEEAGNAFLCSVEDGAGCDERERNYIEKMRGKSIQNHKAQLDRIARMEGGSMKPELKKWMIKRKKILKQMVASGSTGLEEEL